LLVRPWRLPALQHPAFRVLWGTTLVLLLSFGLLSLHTRVEINWSAAGLLSFPVTAAYGLCQRHRFSQRINRLWPVVPSLLVLVLLLKPAWPDRLAGQTVLPLVLDPLQQLAGWSETGRWIGRVAGQLPGRVVLASDTYQLASLLAFYTPGHPPTYCLPYPQRRFNQFDLWPSLPTQPGYTYLYIGDEPMPQVIRKQWKDVRLLAMWQVQYRTVIVRRLYAYRAWGYLPDPAAKPNTY
jgi:hypothetical protein